MSELVKRLRQYAEQAYEPFGIALCREAADAIESLQPACADGFVMDDAEVRAWAGRNDIQAPLTDLRAMIEDAQTIPMLSAAKDKTT